MKFVTVLPMMQELQEVHCLLESLCSSVPKAWCWTLEVNKLLSWPYPSPGLFRMLQLAAGTKAAVMHGERAVEA